MKADGEALSRGMLFAAIACGSGANEELIKEVFDAWRTLPEGSPEDDDWPWSDKRFYVANHCLSGGLRRIKSGRTIEPLLRLSNEAEEMQHTIYRCLEQIDHPLAAGYVASHIAKMDVRIEGDEKRHNHLASSRLADFGSGLNHHVRYTKPTMDALEAIWFDTSKDLWE
ncbi:MAG: hypothetical protein ABJO27_04820 [Pseudoruegeria sp.]